MTLFHVIRTDPMECAEFLSRLPRHLAATVYGFQDKYLVDSSTKAVFDEFGLDYVRVDVLWRVSTKGLRLKFFKGGSTTRFSQGS